MASVLSVEMDRQSTGQELLTSAPWMHFRPFGKPLICTYILGHVGSWWWCSQGGELQLFKISKEVLTSKV